MKRVLVTGGTGFVGKQVLRELLSRRAEVTVVLRPGRPVPDGIVATHITEDIFSESVEFWAKACDGIDTLVHVAWYAEPGKYVTSAMNLTCISGTIRMAEAAASVGVKRFVGVGSCFEYDLNAGCLKTSTPLAPSSPYGAAKAATYLALSRALPHLCVSFAWCRLFYLYGEGEDHRRLVPYLRQRLAAGEPAELTSGQQIRDYLDVTEAGRRIAAITLSSAEGAFNICSGIPVTIEHMARRIAEEYGRTDLLRFGVRPDNPEDPPCIIGEPTSIADNNDHEIA
jgi:dTDP-6-deoxy-L-talose 4-dehydrogenase (NAD+)